MVNVAKYTSPMDPMGYNPCINGLVLQSSKKKREILPGFLSFAQVRLQAEKVSSYELLPREQTVHVPFLC